MTQVAQIFEEEKRQVLAQLWVYVPKREMRIMQLIFVWIPDDNAKIPQNPLILRYFPF